MMNVLVDETIAGSAGACLAEGGVETGRAGVGGLNVRDLYDGEGHEKKSKLACVFVFFSSSKVFRMQVR